jgi:outer membrane protein OmpA-like peptidoglycan-associated protein
MKKNISIAFLSIIFTVFSHAQNVDFKSANFKDDKDGLKAAQDAIKTGDEYREKGMEAIFATKDPGLNFLLALQEYNKAQKFNPSNAELNFKIATCFAHSNSKYQMVSYMLKSMELDPKADPFQNYYMGLALQYQGKFDEALKQYQLFENEYKKADNYAKFVKRRKEECKAAPGFIGTPERVWVDNVSDINSEFDDYGPSVMTDGSQIIFSSNRKNSRTPNQAGIYDSDVYFSDLVNGKWVAPKPVDGGINTGEEEASSMISYDGTKMLIYRSNTEKGMDVFESKLKGLKWSAPEDFSVNINTKDNQTFASYSYDDVIIYYVNDRVLGESESGTDIYFSGAIDKKSRKYGSGQPLSNVNSKFNEGPIYMHPNGRVMYFCSEGHNSMGGMDIFMSRKKQGQWSEPVNLGYPINSPYDDMFFGVTASGKYAYIASNRDGGKGGYDIYRVTFWGPEKKPLVDTEDYLIASMAFPVQNPQLASNAAVERVSLTVFKGKTIDAITKKPVEATIDIIDNSNGSVINTFTTNSATGKFLLSLNAGKNYGIAVKAQGYLFHSENFDIPNESEYNLVDKEIELKNIAVGSKIALRNIFFATGSATLKSESNTELDRLVKLMKDVPSLKVEISGHTDNVGSPSMNEKLSQDRATSVVTYLIGKGIDKGRLTAKGYGETRPVGSNNSAEGRQENRRVEFEILAN